MGIISALFGKSKKQETLEMVQSTDAILDVIESIYNRTSDDGTVITEWDPFAGTRLALTMVSEDSKKVRGVLKTMCDSTQGSQTINGIATRNIIVFDLIAGDFKGILGKGLMEEPFPRFKNQIGLLITSLTSFRNSLANDTRKSVCHSTPIFF